MLRVAAAVYGIDFKFNLIQFINKFLVSFSFFLSPVSCLFVQIFDASTNTWKIVNERSHTDFVEKIVETPRETIIIDDVTDITKIKNINDRTERTTAITDITDVTNINNTINLHEIEENITKIVTNENNLVSQSWRRKNQAEKDLIRENFITTAMIHKFCLF